MYAVSIPLSLFYWQTVSTNEIRMTYIETEMARRHIRSDSQGAPEGHADDGAARRASDLKLPQRQPATLGKLHEIDLGPDSKLQNIARTQEATRKLAGNEDGRTDILESRGTKTPQPESGDKRFRGRRRRNSDDIRRDQLVEEVLRESKREYISCIASSRAQHSLQILTD
jgi:hypothetical protein